MADEPQAFRPVWLLVLPGRGFVLFLMLLRRQPFLVDFNGFSFDYDATSPGRRPAQPALDHFPHERQKQENGRDIGKESRQNEKDAGEKAQQAADRGIGADIAFLGRFSEFVQRFDAGMANGHTPGDEPQYHGKDRKPGAEPLPGLNQQKELEKAERKKDKKNGSDHLEPVRS